MTKRRLSGTELIKSTLESSYNHSDIAYTNHHINPQIIGKVEGLINSSDKQRVHVIEFGARAGALGYSLASRFQNIAYLGVEPYPPLTSTFNIYQDTCESFAKSRIGQALLSTADILIYADVLEHLDNPWQHLADVNTLCSPTAMIVASVPNFFHHSAMKLISHGRFDYEEWGVLDFTHKRFFGFENIIELFNLTKWHVNITEVEAAFDPEGVEIINRFRHCQNPPLILEFGNLSIKISSIEDAMRLAAYQYILTAQNLRD